MTMEKVDAFEVGWLFVQEYYTILNREPTKLHCFYNKKSLFLHGYEGETVPTCHGQTEIHNRILELGFSDCKVLVSNVDSQASLNGGIIVQVLGELSNRSGASHKFAQTFFLAEQPNGYYVLNDIFRFLKEDLPTYQEQEVIERPVSQQKPVIQQKPAIQQKPVPQERHSPVQERPVSPLKEKVASPPQKQESIKPQPAEPPKPIEPPKPSKPATPKSWASLAASTTPNGVPVGVVQPVQPVQKKDKAVDESKGTKKERHSIYIRNVPETIARDALKQAFSAIGAVRHVDLPTGKGMAFVEFVEEESVAKAIGKEVNINGVKLVAEERRKNLKPKKKFNKKKDL